MAKPVVGVVMGSRSDWAGTMEFAAATLDDIRIDVFRKGETKLFLVDFKLSRDDVITLPAGNLGMAIGAEFRNESFVDDRDPRLDGTITFTNSVTGDTYGGDVAGGRGRGTLEVGSGGIGVAGRVRRLASTGGECEHENGGGCHSIEATGWA